MTSFLAIRYAAADSLFLGASGPVSDLNVARLFPISGTSAENPAALDAATTAALAAAGKLSDRATVGQLRAVGAPSLDAAAAVLASGVVVRVTRRVVVELAPETEPAA